MKGMLQVQDKLKIQRESIIQLLHQLTIEYPTLKSEMKQISGQDSGGDDEFTFLEEFELVTLPQPKGVRASKQLQ